MNYFEEFRYKYNTSYRNALISNMQHYVKANDKPDCDKLFGTLPFSLDSLNEQERIQFARLAVYVEYSYHRRDWEAPAWAYDRRLYLKTPYLGSGYKAIWLFTCPQECLSHNVFIESGSLEVV
jgi:hypothetical protein